MPKFSCTVRQDAWIYHDCEIEAETAEEAAQKAERAWRRGDPKVTFTEGGSGGFDHAECEADDCEEIEA